jgi:hypothetical protein
VRELKNIDRLFQENLKDFEVFPPNKSWDEINGRLVNSPKKNRLPFWLKISSIAALFMLFFSVGTIYFIPENNFTKKFLPNKNNKTNKLENSDTLNTIVESSKINTLKQQPSKSKVIPLNAKEITNSIVNNEQEIVDANIPAEKTTAKKTKSLNRFELTDTKNLPFTNETKAENRKTSGDRFTVATIFAPIYFNSFGKGSGADSEFNNNQTSGSSSYSYGVKFAYKINKKFSVQSGVNLINLGHKTNDVYVTPGVAIVSFSNISSQPHISKNDAGLTKQSFDIEDENSASLNQSFGYVEIPIEIKYNVAEGKIGINIVGGFSTLLLNKDEVFIETNTFSQSLGNSNNLRDINFSGNLGLDIDYSLYKNLFINVSPMFKVQTNTFSKNPNNIQTYYLGIYTGLNYKF